MLLFGLMADTSGITTELCQKNTIHFYLIIHCIKVRVAQSVARLTEPVVPCSVSGPVHTFVEIAYDIFPTVI